MTAHTIEALTFPDLTAMQKLIGLVAAGHRLSRVSQTPWVRRRCRWTAGRDGDLVIILGDMTRRWQDGIAAEVWPEIMTEASGRAAHARARREAAAVTTRAISFLSAVERAHMTPSEIELAPRLNPTGIEECMIHQIYVGKVRDTDVRFFPPQADDALMPWVTADELITALSLDGIARVAAQLTSKEFGRRIGTPKGMATVMCFATAKALVKVTIERGHVDPGIEDDFANQVFEAAQQIHPEMFHEKEDGKRTINTVSIARLTGQHSEDLNDLFEKHREKLGSMGTIRHRPPA